MQLPTIIYFSFDIFAVQLFQVKKKNKVSLYAERLHALMFSIKDILAAKAVFEISKLDFNYDNYSLDFCISM